MFQVPTLNTLFGAGQVNQPPSSFNVQPENIMDAEFQVISGGPIQLTQDDLMKFTRYVDAFWGTAEGNMSFYHKYANRDRMIYHLIPRKPRYPGAPSYTTPFSANKAKGAAAHFKEAIEQTELLGTKVRSIGQVAEYASMVSTIIESYINRELELGNSRQIIANDIPQEAAVMGTAISQISVGSQPINNEYFFQFNQLIPLENVYFDRIDVANTWQTNVGIVERFPIYDLQELADANIVDPMVVKSLANGNSILNRAFNEYMYNFYPQTEQGDGNKQVEVQKGWFRFKASGDKVAQYYEYMRDRSTRRFLYVRPNSFGAIYNAPPITLWRIGKNPRNILGTGVIRRMAQLQDMMDNEINNYFSVSNYVASPAHMYRQSSPFGQALAKNGRGGIYPGALIPTSQAPKDDDIKPIRLEANPGVMLANTNLINDFGDKISYTDQSLGQSSSSRTLGQYQVEVQKGSLLLRDDLAHLSYDASVNGALFFACLKYKIKKYGIVEVYEGGKLLAFDDIPIKNIQNQIRGFVFSMAMQSGMSPDELLAFETSFSDRLVDGYIPGVNRSDIAISLKGTKIIADKVADLSMLLELSPYLASWLQPSYQDSYYNYHLRSIMQAMGFKDIDRRMPRDPNKVVKDQQAQMELMNQYMQYAMSVSAR